ncbi:ABC transporter permease [candidate division KSB1 bacterium]|nr:ABC transporter permease [candidate division KSB1 bacterium]
MVKNYLKIGIRNLLKYKIHSFINIIGLAIGMACTLLILLWVQDELSFDRFHTDRDVIYRILGQGKEIKFFGSPAPLAPTLKDEVPEIVDAVRVRELPRFVFKYGENAFYENKGIAVDPAFFDIFTFPFMKGDVKSAFADPFFIVITEAMAKKYFGTEDPIDKPIDIEGQGFLTVKGVLKNVPHNSHLQFDYLLPYRFLENVRICGLEWGDFNFYTYIKLVAQKQENDIDDKITAVALKHNCPQVKYDGLKFFVQPLSEMYLHPVSNYDIPLGNVRYVYVFSMIALFILSIAAINFINLSTARSMTRAKEVGVRKVVGAQRQQLIAQFFGEYLVVAVIALFLSLILIELFMPAFNSLSEKHLTFDIFNIRFLLALLVIILITGLATGLYPACYLSSIQPVKIFKAIVKSGSHESLLRKILVVSQFALSIVLIIGTVIILRQLQYIHNKSLNRDREVILHFPIKENIGQKFDLVRDKLLMNPAILAVSAKDCLPNTINNNTTGIWWEGKTDDQNDLHMETTRTDHDYFKTMGMKIVQGRAFSKDFPSDVKQAYVINEEAVRQAKLENPVGKKFAIYGTEGIIIGVVENTFYHSLKTKLHPQVYHLFTDLPRQGFFGSVFVRIDASKSHQAFPAVISYIGSVWQNINSIAPFEYHFLDDTIDAQYKNEQRLMTLFSIFAGLAIFISCLGLFGLITFMSEIRRKEIGIRKVLGASVSGIVTMLSREYLKWVLIANVFAWPISWFAMNRWLQNFAYRINLGWDIFVFSSVLALAIALITVSFQSIRAALANPVESLRYE